MFVDVLDADVVVVSECFFGHELHDACEAVAAFGFFGVSAAADAAVDGELVGLVLVVDPLSDFVQWAALY